jgi:hypothetical protein
MQVDFCDMCGAIIKDKFFTLYIASPKYSTSSDSDDYGNCNETYNDYLTKIRNESKIMCPNCKIIFDEIFRLRLNQLSELTAELYRIYESPTRTTKYEKEQKEKRKEDKKD